MSSTSTMSVGVIFVVLVTTPVVYASIFISIVPSGLPPGPMWGIAVLRNTTPSPWLVFSATLFATVAAPELLSAITGTAVTSITIARNADINLFIFGLLYDRLIFNKVIKTPVWFIDVFMSTQPLYVEVISIKIVVFSDKTKNRIKLNTLSMLLYHINNNL